MVVLVRALRNQIHRLAGPGGLRYGRAVDRLPDVVVHARAVGAVDQIHVDHAGFQHGDLNGLGLGLKDLVLKLCGPGADAGGLIGRGSRHVVDRFDGLGDLVFACADGGGGTGPGIDLLIPDVGDGIIVVMVVREFIDADVGCIVVGIAGKPRSAGVVLQLTVIVCTGSSLQARNVLARGDAALGDLNSPISVHRLFGCRKRHAVAGSPAQVIIAVLEGEGSLGGAGLHGELKERGAVGGAQGGVVVGDVGVDSSEEVAVIAHDTVPLHGIVAPVAEDDDVADLQSGDQLIIAVGRDGRNEIGLGLEVAVFEGRGVGGAFLVGHGGHGVALGDLVQGVAAVAGADGVGGAGGVVRSPGVFGLAPDMAKGVAFGAVRGVRGIEDVEIGGISAGGAGRGVVLQLLPDLVAGESGEGVAVAVVVAGQVVDRVAGVAGVVDIVLRRGLAGGGGEDHAGLIEALIQGVLVVGEALGVGLHVGVGGAFVVHRRAGVPDQASEVAAGAPGPDLDLARVGLVDHVDVDLIGGLGRIDRGVPGQLVDRDGLLRGRVGGEAGRAGVVLQ